MDILPLIGVLVITVLIFIFAGRKIHNEKLSVKKYWALVLLPSTLLGVLSYLEMVFRTHNLVSGFSSIFMLSMVGFVVMLPALILYAVIVLSLEKRFSPPAWKLFLWTGLVAGLSALPYDLMMGKWVFSWIAMVTGTLSMLIVYFVSRWRDKKNRRK